MRRKCDWRKPERILGKIIKRRKRKALDQIDMPRFVRSIGCSRLQFCLEGIIEVEAYAGLPARRGKTILEDRISCAGVWVRDGGVTYRSFVKPVTGAGKIRAVIKADRRRHNMPDGLQGTFFKQDSAVHLG